MDARLFSKDREALLPYCSCYFAVTDTNTTLLLLLFMPPRSHLPLLSMLHLDNAVTALPRRRCVGKRLRAYLNGQLFCKANLVTEIPCVFSWKRKQQDTHVRKGFMSVQWSVPDLRSKKVDSRNTCKMQISFLRTAT